MREKGQNTIDEKWGGEDWDDQSCGVGSYLFFLNIWQATNSNTGYTDTKSTESKWQLVSLFHLQNVVSCSMSHLPPWSEDFQSLLPDCTGSWKPVILFYDQLSSLGVYLKPMCSIFNFQTTREDGCETSEKKSHCKHTPTPGNTVYHRTLGPKEGLENVLWIFHYTIGFSFCYNHHAVTIIFYFQWNRYPH